ncbi:EI24 domain-containing protein [Hymenobacter terrenus]|uniref:EI24 domain-containing protein n=1 Tax=Hymenobacter terrenus TaxID=1629124 RepID=UPI0021CD9292|nr:EI24 domain-containing protein [Hymenobacter terrenus]
MVVCLFIPVVNGILILLIGCYYSAKSLVGDALEDVATFEEQKQLTRDNRLGILVMGLLHFALLLVPFVGLLAPAIIGSSMCHFCFRAKARQLAI